MERIGLYVVFEGEKEMVESTILNKVNVEVAGKKLEMVVTPFIGPETRLSKEDYTVATQYTPVKNRTYVVESVKGLKKLEEQLGRGLKPSDIASGRVISLKTETTNTSEEKAKKGKLKLAVLSMYELDYLDQVRGSKFNLLFAAIGAEVK